MTVLMVVGAGRGPLVRASLAAADAAGRPLRVYAVEKNANAVITLQNLVQSEGCAERLPPPCSNCAETLPAILDCGRVLSCYNWGRCKQVSVLLELAHKSGHQGYGEADY